MEWALGDLMVAVAVADDGSSSLAERSYAKFAEVWADYERKRVQLEFVSTPLAAWLS